MDRLLLTQRLSRESGVNFVGPSTTISQTGMYLQLVEWIDTAHSNLQTLHPTWEFLRKEFSKVLTPATGTYTPSTLSVSDWGEWAPEDWRIYLVASDEGYLPYVRWDKFRQTYGIGSSITATDRPICFTVKPDDSIVFYPIPNTAVTVKGEYFRAPLIWTANADIPLWAARDFDIGIMWRALMFYGTSYAESDKFAVGQMEYRKILRQMEKKYLPRVKFGEPLA